MKAIICSRFGGPDVLEIQTMPTPEPAAGQVRVKVRATAVSSGDSRMRRGSKESLPMWPVSKLAIGLGRPRNPIFGFSYAGVVDALGAGVSGFSIGDAVFGGGGSCHAEYVCVRASGTITHKPAGMSFEQAAGLAFGAGSALFLLRQAGIAAGQRVLVYGASGSVGLAAVQLAKYFGSEVTAVCSGANVDLVRRLGADDVIDYTREDFAKRSTTYDIVLDTVGKTYFPDIKHTLKPGGRHALAVMEWRDIAQIAITSFGRGKRVQGGVANVTKDDMALFVRLFEEGRFESVVDGSYPFDQAAAAHARVDSGRKRGDVVLTLN